MSAHLDALIRNGLAVGFRLTTNQWEELIVALTAQSGRNGGLDVAVIAALEQWRLDNRMELGILAMQCLGLVELGLLDLDEALLDLTGIKASDCAHLPLTVAASIDARIRGNVVGEKMASGEGRCNACGGAGETSSDAVSPTASHTRLAGNRDGEPQHARVQADQSEDGQDGQYRQSQMESGGLKRRRLDDGDQSGTSADRGTATEGLDVVPPAPAPTPEVEDTNQVTVHRPPTRLLARSQSSTEHGSQAPDRGSGTERATSSAIYDSVPAMCQAVGARLAASDARPAASSGPKRHHCQESACARTIDDDLFVPEADDNAQAGTTHPTASDNSRDARRPGMLQAEAISPGHESALASDSESHSVRAAGSELAARVKTLETTLVLHRQELDFLRSRIQVLMPDFPEEEQPEMAKQAQAQAEGQTEEQSRPTPESGHAVPPSSQSHRSQPQPQPRTPARMSTAVTAPSGDATPMLATPQRGPLSPRARGNAGQSPARPETMASHGGGSQSTTPGRPKSEWVTPSSTPLRASALSPSQMAQVIELD